MPSIAEVRAQEEREKAEFDKLPDMLSRVRRTDGAVAAQRVQGTFDEVLTEIRRAVEKHGDGATPLNRSMHWGVKLAVLMEEVGEVAEALTYDNPKNRDLGAELVQVATMALAWRASLT